LRGRKNKNIAVLILLLILGAVLGGILGELIVGIPSLAGMTPYLVKQFTVFDIPPVAINLYVVKFVVGFALYPNLISILGMLIALLVYWRF